MNYIPLFKERKIMVIGDIIADEFIIGQPERLSREAPVLILLHRNTEILPGGGANAAYNICSLGGSVSLVGVIGDDRAGRLLSQFLQEKGIKTGGIAICQDRPTALKTRILAGGEQVVKQQVVRIDRLDRSPIKKDIEEKILDYISSGIENIDGILLSDYGNGVFTERVKREVIQLARKKKKVVSVDTRFNLRDFRGATIATPNLEEAGYALGRSITTQAEVIDAGKELLPQMDLDYLLITQGGEGMTIFTRGGDYKHIPAANYTEVFDVTGAGDTVVGTLTLALSSGADIYTAMKLANYAAGIVIRKSGVATVTPEELRKEVLKNGGKD